EAKPNISEEIARLQDKTEKELFNLKKECQGYAPEALDTLMEIIRDEKPAGYAAKLRAIREILDRGYGKPREKEATSEGFQLIVHRADSKI
ncbi:MAG: hypothetical protein Q7I94_02190, partial [Candidatus Contubernalis sp.]|nr:hypothetical protein [Candidatus Contubernalis sp.]